MIDAALASEERRVLLVDGFNVLHATVLKSEREAGWWRTALRERLLRRIGGWPQASDEIWVAFDGSQPSWSVWAEPVATPHPRRGTEGDSHGIANDNNSHSSSHYTPHSVIHSVYVESADDWIVRRARKTEHPDRTVVVTADRQVAGRARSAGCEIWTPWAFMSRCPAEPDPPSTPPSTRTTR